MATLALTFHPLQASYGVQREGSGDYKPEAARAATPSLYFYSRLPVAIHTWAESGCVTLSFVLCPCNTASEIRQMKKQTSGLRERNSLQKHLENAICRLSNPLEQKKKGKGQKRRKIRKNTEIYLSGPKKRQTHNKLKKTASRLGGDGSFSRGIPGNSGEFRGNPGNSGGLLMSRSNVKIWRKNVYNRAKSVFSLWLLEKVLHSNLHNKPRC